MVGFHHYLLFCGFLIRTIVYSTPKPYSKLSRPLHYVVGLGLRMLLRLRLSDCPDASGLMVQILRMTENL